jgi:hypothetical protein
LPQGLRPLQRKQQWKQQPAPRPHPLPLHWQWHTMPKTLQTLHRQKQRKPRKWPQKLQRKPWKCPTWRLNMQELQEKTNPNN